MEELQQGIATCPIDCSTLIRYSNSSAGSGLPSEVLLLAKVGDWLNVNQNSVFLPYHTHHFTQSPLDAMMMLKDRKTSFDHVLEPSMSFFWLVCVCFAFILLLLLLKALLPGVLRIFISRHLMHAMGRFIRRQGDMLILPTEEEAFDTNPVFDVSQGQAQGMLNPLPSIDLRNPPRSVQPDVEDRGITEADAQDLGVHLH